MRPACRSALALKPETEDGVSDGVSAGVIAIHGGRRKGGDGPSPKAGGGGWSQTRVGSDDAVKVSLSDCLACSGCVTSAETVLMDQQSADEFTAALATVRRGGGAGSDAGTGYEMAVVSIAPQVKRCTLSSAHGLHRTITCCTD